MKTIKRISLLLTVLLLAVMCFAVTAGAEDEYFTEGDYTYLIKNEEIYITQIRSDETETLYIPDNLAGYPVTHVEMEFESCKMKSIVIPDSVTHIYRGKWQSNYPNNAKTLMIGSGVQLIEDNAFSKWASLEKITVSGDNKYFVTDENGILYNGEMTRLVCFPLACEISEYDMPDTVNDCYTDFSYCKHLEKITISDSLKYFPQFSYSEKLREVVISDSVVGITKEYLQNCKKLEKVTFGNNVSYIGEGAFRGCESLKKIVLPASITSVGESAFSGCTSLSEVEIVGNIKEIKDWTFEDCKALKKITLPSTVKTIGKGAFSECQVQTVVFGGTREDFNAIEINNDRKFNQSFIDADVSCSPLSATKKIISTATASSITLKWTAVDGADGYTLYEKTENGWKSLGVTTKTTATLKNLSTAKVYTYAVRAGKLEGGKVVWSLGHTTHKTATAPLAPAKVTSGMLFGKNLELSWTECEGATGYRIYRKTDNGWEVIREKNSDEYMIFVSPAPGTRNTYAVRPYIETEDALILGGYTTHETAIKAVAPTKITVAQNTTALRLTWTACPGATGYRIYYKSGNSWKIALNTTSATTHTFTGLKAGSKFTVAVRPYIKLSDRVVWSDYTTYDAATLPVAPKVSAVSTLGGSVTVSWSAVNGAEGYQLFFKVNNGSYKLYKTYPSAQKLTFNGLVKGAKYTFAVRAYKKTTGGYIFGAYKPVSATIAYKITRYSNVFKSGTFMMVVDDPDLGEVTQAMKNGNMYIRSSMDGMDMTLVYKKSNEKWYMIMHDLKKYTVMPEDMLSDMDMDELNEEMQKDEKIAYKTSYVTVKGKKLECESGKNSEGDTYKYYFDGDTLVISQTVSADGETTTTYFKSITNKVSDSLFKIPSGYAYMEIEWLFSLASEAL